MQVKRMSKYSASGQDSDQGPILYISRIFRVTLRQVFFLAETPPLQCPHTPPPYTLYTCIQYTYSHMEGGGGRGRELTRERLEG
jgi:hypothetical protein